eukprot:SAG31_NODE_4219_length_3450_cov_3.587586_4_plen_182_part_00
MDHYPANLFAMLGLALTVLSTLGYNMVLMLRLHLVGNVWLTTFSSWIIIFVSVIELVFINVFPANLYVMDGDHHHPVDSEGFRIFPAINDTTATDVTLDSLNFTRVEIEALTDHTVFFILWVLSNFVLVRGLLHPHSLLILSSFSVLSACRLLHCALVAPLVCRRVSFDSAVVPRRGSTFV